MPCAIRMRKIFLRGLLWLYLISSEFLAMSLEPGFLDFDNLPDTNFSCVGKVIGGYYADLETNCQMFHVCTIGQLDEPMDIRFLCLNGTVFDQETRVCERIDEVDCSKSEQFYSLNLELYGNTQPPILEETSETEPPIIIRTTPSSTTMTPRPNQKPTPIHYFTSSLPSLTTKQPQKKIPSHHFPLGTSTDIRFNPEEINISLNPGAPPDIRTKQPLSFHHQQTFSDNVNSNNKKVVVTAHNLDNQRASTDLNLAKQVTTLKPHVVSFSLTRENDKDSDYQFNFQPTEARLRPQLPGFHFHSNLRPQIHPYSTRHATFKSSTYRSAEFEPTTRRGFSVSSTKGTTLGGPLVPPLRAPSQYSEFQEKTEKPQRLQLPIPLLPTLPPLTFSSPAPFTIARSGDNKRFTNEHPRIVISASASVSDASGRRLNYSLGTIGAAEILEAPPSSYDEYKDEDVVLDPFYHDVPKIQKPRKKRHLTRNNASTRKENIRQPRKTNEKSQNSRNLKQFISSKGHRRRKRQAEAQVNPTDIISEKEAIDILKFLFDWYKNHEKTSTVTIPVKPEVITEINQSLSTKPENSIETNPELTTDNPLEEELQTQEYKERDNFRESRLFNKDSIATYPITSTNNEASESHNNHQNVQEDDYADDNEQFLYSESVIGKTESILDSHEYDSNKSLELNAEHHINEPKTHLEADEYSNFDFSQPQLTAIAADSNEPFVAPSTETQSQATTSSPSERNVHNVATDTKENDADPNVGIPEYVDDNYEPLTYKTQKTLAEVQGGNHEEQLANPTADESLKNLDASFGNHDNNTEVNQVLSPSEDGLKDVKETFGNNDHKTDDAGASPTADDILKNVNTTLDYDNYSENLSYQQEAQSGKYLEDSHEISFGVQNKTVTPEDQPNLSEASYSDERGSQAPVDEQNFNSGVENDALSTQNETDQIHSVITGQNLDDSHQNQQEDNFGQSVATQQSGKDTEEDYSEDHRQPNHGNEEQLEATSDNTHDSQTFNPHTTFEDHQSYDRNSDNSQESSTDDSGKKQLLSKESPTDDFGKEQLLSKTEEQSTLAQQNQGDDKAFASKDNVQDKNSMWFKPLVPERAKSENHQLQPPEPSNYRDLSSVGKSLDGDTSKFLDKEISLQKSEVSTKQNDYSPILGEDLSKFIKNYVSEIFEANTYKPNITEVQTVPFLPFDMYHYELPSTEAVTKDEDPSSKQRLRGRNRLPDKTKSIDENITSGTDDPSGNIHIVDTGKVVQESPSSYEVTEEQISAKSPEATTESKRSRSRGRLFQANHHESSTSTRSRSRGRKKFLNFSTENSTPDLTSGTTENKLDALLRKLSEENDTHPNVSKLKSWATSSTLSVSTENENRPMGNTTSSPIESVSEEPIGDRNAEGYETSFLRGKNFDNNERNTKDFQLLTSTSTVEPENTISGHYITKDQNLKSYVDGSSSTSGPGVIPIATEASSTPATEFTTSATVPLHTKPKPNERRGSRRRGSKNFRENTSKAPGAALGRRRGSRFFSSSTAQTTESLSGTTSNSFHQDGNSQRSQNYDQLFTTSSATLVNRIQNHLPNSSDLSKDQKANLFNVAEINGNSAQNLDNYSTQIGTTQIQSVSTISPQSRQQVTQIERRMDQQSLTNVATAVTSQSTLLEASGTQVSNTEYETTEAVETSKSTDTTVATEVAETTQNTETTEDVETTEYGGKANNFFTLTTTPTNQPILTITFNSGKYHIEHESPASKASGGKRGPTVESSTGFKQKSVQGSEMKSNTEAASAKKPMLTSTDESLDYGWLRPMKFDEVVPAGTAVTPPETSTASIELLEKTTKSNTVSLLNTPEISAPDKSGEVNTQSKELSKKMIDFIKEIESTTNSVAVADMGSSTGGESDVSKDISKASPVTEVNTFINVREESGHRNQRRRRPNGTTKLKNKNYNNSERKTDSGDGLSLDQKLEESIRQIDEQILPDSMGYNLSKSKLHHGKDETNTPDKNLRYSKLGTTESTVKQFSETGVPPTKSHEISTKTNDLETPEISTQSSEVTTENPTSTKFENSEQFVSNTFSVSDAPLTKSQEVSTNVTTAFTPSASNEPSSRSHRRLRPKFRQNTPNRRAPSSHRFSTDSFLSTSAPKFNTLQDFLTTSIQSNAKKLQTLTSPSITTTRSDDGTTDPPFYRSVSPTQAKSPKFDLSTTPLSALYKVQIRKEKVNSHYIFNCFGKTIDKFYSDPRDCRLFHYCTRGYTKSQLLDMKFVCDFGTFFDDEKLICTKELPKRCT